MKSSMKSSIEDRQSSMSFLLHNLLHFGRLLHDLGLDVHAGRMLDVTRALAHVEIGRRSDVYFTLRSLLVHRQHDLATFDEAFNAFWRAEPTLLDSLDLPALGEHRRQETARVDIPAQEPPSLDDSPLPTLSNTIGRTAPLSYSPQETFQHKDFASLSEDEMKQAEAMIEALTWDVGSRRTERWTAVRGRALDLRTIVRRNLKYGGEPVERPTRGRQSKRRPLVLIADVSGSMDRYARMLICFVHGLTGELQQVETFVFATRLTRITRELVDRPASQSLALVPGRTPDWGGGTRIGDALRQFNVGWARRVMGHGPVVLLISDGWDRGDPDVLQREMGRLRRSCHRLIWLNPLLGSADYQPLTRGMQAALPFVHDFLPVHNLASLQALAERLNQISERGAHRRFRS
ncbi:MAG: CoxE [Blastocatellia bacterium]|nr:MAG: CoxE [Blastocatellia bacterium]